MKINFGQFAEKTKSYYNHLEKRQRLMALILISALVFSAYYNFVYRQGSSALAAVKEELTRANNELARIRSLTPDAAGEREKLNTAKRLYKELLERLKAVEAGLPTQGRVPQIMGELVRQAEGYSIDFASIRQKNARPREEYPELGVEIKFNAVFSDLINYITRVESVSPFLKVSDIRIEEMKKNFGGMLTSTLTLTTLIGEEPKEALASAKPSELLPPVSVERNPFMPRFISSKDKEAKEEKLRLSGIIAKGKRPTAIINDEVYKVGDNVGDKVVKSILPAAVVLSGSGGDEVLTLRQ